MRTIIKRGSRWCRRCYKNKTSINTLNSTSVDESHERNSFALRSNEKVLHHMLKSGAAISGIFFVELFLAIWCHKNAFLMFLKIFSLFLHMYAHWFIWGDTQTWLSNDEKLTFSLEKIKHVKNVWSVIFQRKKKIVLELILCLEISEWNLIENCLENVNF